MQRLRFKTYKQELCQYNYVEAFDMEFDDIERELNEDDTADHCTCGHSDGHHHCLQDECVLWSCQSFESDQAMTNDS